MGRRRRGELHESLRAQGMADVTRALARPARLRRSPSTATRTGASGCRHCWAAPTCAWCRGPAIRTPTTRPSATPHCGWRRSPRTGGRTRSGCGTGYEPDDRHSARHAAFAHRLTEERAAAQGGRHRPRSTSQLKPGPDGADRSSAPEMLEHFERDVEVVFRQPPRHRRADQPVRRTVRPGRGPVARATEVVRAAQAGHRAGRACPASVTALAVEPACGIGRPHHGNWPHGATGCWRSTRSRGRRASRAHTSELPGVDVTVGAAAQRPAGRAGRSGRVQRDPVLPGRPGPGRDGGPLRSSAAARTGIWWPCTGCRGRPRRRGTAWRRTGSCWPIPGSTRWSSTWTSGSCCTCWSGDDHGRRCRGAGAGRERG